MVWNQETGGASEQRRHLGKKVQNIGKRVLVDRDWECIVETNVPIVEKKTSDCTFLRSVFLLHSYKYVLYQDAVILLQVVLTVYIFL